MPRNGLIVQCVWASLLTLSGTYSDLLDYVIFAVLIFYVLTMAGLFVLRRTRPDAERPYRAVGYPIASGALHYRRVGHRSGSAPLGKDPGQCLARSAHRDCRRAGLLPLAHLLDFARQVDH